MAILIRLLAFVIVIGGIYFAIKKTTNKEKENDDFKKRNEIYQLKEKLAEAENDHREEVNYLNGQLAKLRKELSDTKATHNVD